jgi:hypothetical protein
VRGLDVVVSVGDILLVPGCAVLLAAFLAPAFLYAPSHLAAARTHRASTAHDMSDTRLG